MLSRTGIVSSRHPSVWSVPATWLIGPPPAAIVHAMTPAPDRRTAPPPRQDSAPTLRLVTAPVAPPPPAGLRLVGCRVEELSGDHYVLVGDADAAVELRGPGAVVLAGAVSTLAGTGDMSAARAGLSADDDRAFRALLDELRAHGLATVDPCGPGRGIRVGLVGEGPLAKALTPVVAALGDLTLFGECLPPVASRQPLSTRRKRAKEPRPLHWTQSGEQGLDLVIIATTRREPDPALGWLLARAATPHLSVTAHRGQTIVSGISVPGVTACMLCAGSAGGSRPLKAWRAAAPAEPDDSDLAWAASQVRRAVDTFRTTRTIWPTLHSDGAVEQPHMPDPECPACGAMAAAHRRRRRDGTPVMAPGSSSCRSTRTAAA